MFYHQSLSLAFLFSCMHMPSLILLSPLDLFFNIYVILGYSHFFLLL